MAKNFLEFKIEYENDFITDLIIKKVAELREKGVDCLLKEKQRIRKSTGNARILIVNRSLMFTSIKANSILVRGLKFVAVGGDGESGE